MTYAKGEDVRAVTSTHTLQPRPFCTATLLIPTRAEPHFSSAEACERNHAKSALITPVLLYQGDGVPRDEAALEWSCNGRAHSVNNPPAEPLVGECVTMAFHQGAPDHLCTNFVGVHRCEIPQRNRRSARRCC